MEFCARPAKRGRQVLGRTRVEGTFLNLFITGEAPTSLASGLRDYLRSYLPEKLRMGLSKAVADLPPEVPSADMTGRDFDKLSLLDAVQVLIDDFYQYLDVVRFWKFFVYSVRFLLNRERQNPGEYELPGQNLNWMFPQDEV